MDKFVDLVKTYINILPKLRLPWSLPRWYVKLFIFGLVLVGLNYSYIPNLTYCSGLFGGDFCSPIGIYLIAFISLPGYLIINLILPDAAIANDSFYSLIVFVTAILVYSIVGFLYSKRKKVKLDHVGIVYLTFLSLLFVFLVLLFLIRR